MQKVNTKLFYIKSFPILQIHNHMYSSFSIYLIINNLNNKEDQVRKIAQREEIYHLEITV